ncbi:pyridoxine biosynthesis protein [Pestalotiopsis sp. IQ-011]
MVLVAGTPPAQQVDILTNESSSAGSAPSPLRRLTVDLPLDYDACSFAGRSGTIRVNQGEAEGALTLTLNRTIRVPDNRDVSGLPPSLGQFPLFRVQDHAARLPPEMAAKGGLFFPMYQREAMWINFSATRPFAVKVHVGGVNAVSGLPRDDGKDTEKTREKRARMAREGRSVQDYVVVPGQPWLDGIASEDGRIRQFVAKPQGGGFSVEAQVTGQEKTGGIQIEVIPARSGVPREIDVRYEDKRGRVVERALMLADQGISEESSVWDLRRLLAEEFGVPLEDQSVDVSPYDYGLSSSLNPDEDDRVSMKLGNLYFGPTTSLVLSHRMPPPTIDLRYSRAAPPPPPGGGPSIVPEVLCASITPDMSSAAPAAAPYSDTESDDNDPAPSVMPRSFAKSFRVAPPKVKEMGIAAGGLIRQTIEPDGHPADTWDVGAAILLNLQILNSESFSEATGLPPPTTPVDAATYASHGYPFFEIWGEERTGVAGEFGEVKSVAQIEAERARERGEQKPEEESVPQRIHVIGQYRSTFRPVALLKKELEGVKIED